VYGNKNKILSYTHYDAEVHFIMQNAIYLLYCFSVCFALLFIVLCFVFLVFVFYFYSSDFIILCLDVALRQVLPTFLAAA
jgi:hypothetical protein